MFTAVVPYAVFTVQGEPWCFHKTQSNGSCAAFAPRQDCGELAPVCLASSCQEVSLKVTSIIRLSIEYVIMLLSVWSIVLEICIRNYE